MIRPSAPRTALNEYFDSLEDWALMRNADVFANFDRGGDCDLLVKDARKAGLLLERFLGVPLRVARRSYVISYFYEWGHIDLAEHAYWKGIRLCSGVELLDRRATDEEFPRLSGEDEAILLLLNSLLWGGFVKRRYCERVYDVFSDRCEEVSQLLCKMLGSRASQSLLGRVLARDWDGLEGEVRCLRREIFIHHLWLRPDRIVVEMSRFLAFEGLVRVQGLVPILSVSNLDESRELSFFEKAKEIGGLADYSVIVIHRGPWPFHRFVADLKYRSFRGRNGLLIVLTPDEVFSRVAEAKVVIGACDELDEKLVEGIEDVRRLSRRRYKERRGIEIDRGL